MERKDLKSPQPLCNVYNKDETDAVMDAMEAKIRELEANQPKWISVKDRLPPNDYAFVVACDSKGENDITGVWYDCDNNRWDNCVYSFTFEMFTHWMQLPEAPITPTDAKGI